MRLWLWPKPWETFETSRADACVFTFARRVLMEHRRTLLRLVTLADALKLKSGEQIEVSLERSADDALLETEVFEKLEELVGPDRASLLVLRFWIGFSAEELAEERGCTKRNIQEMIQRLLCNPSVIALLRRYGSLWFGSQPS